MSWRFPSPPPPPHFRPAAAVPSYLPPSPSPHPLALSPLQCPLTFPSPGEGVVVMRTGLLRHVER